MNKPKTIYISDIEDVTAGMNQIVDYISHIEKKQTKFNKQIVAVVILGIAYVAITNKKIIKKKLKERSKET